MKCTNGTLIQFYQQHATFNFYHNLPNTQWIIIKCYFNCDGDSQKTLHHIPNKTTHTTHVKALYSDNDLMILWISCEFHETKYANHAHLVEEKYRKRD